MVNQYRFLIVEKTHDAMKVVTEKEVSDRIDMADCNDGEFEILYLNYDGSLEKIKLGNYVSASEESWERGIAGWGDLITAESNKVVGTFTKTDH